MNKRCRGIACIINIFQARGQKPRCGTDVDRDKLEQLFQQLHFDVKVFNDIDGLSAQVSYFAVSFTYEREYTRNLMVI